MILKSCAALAQLRPEWRIRLLFSEISSEALELANHLGVTLIPNLTLGTIFPEVLTLGHAFVGEILENCCPPHRQATAEACIKEWQTILSSGLHLVMTRNLAVAHFFATHLNGSAPRILEIHQLKYNHALAPERGKSLANARKILRQSRAREMRRIGQAHYVFCISESLRRRIQRHLPETATGLLRSAADLHAVESAHLSDGRDIDLLYTGQIYHWKGVHTIIEALRWLPEQIRLTIAGGNNAGDLYALKTFARNFGLENRVEWLGHLQHREVAQIQRRARIGLVPLPFQYHISRWFTSPIKVFEYMAAGAALVVSNVPAMRDILQPGITAEFARPDDPQDWAQVIGRLLSETERRERLAAAALEESRSLTFDRRAAAIAEIIETLVPVSTNGRSIAAGMATS